jgi:hypothetical protein
MVCAARGGISPSFGSAFGAWPVLELSVSAFNIPTAVTHLFTSPPFSTHFHRNRSLQLMLVACGPF